MGEPLPEHYCGARLSQGFCGPAVGHLDASAPNCSGRAVDLYSIVARGRSGRRFTDRRVHTAQGAIPDMVEESASVKVKPACIRCNSSHAVSYVGHWQADWWTCSVCNIRWEDE